ncbi:MAG TPA: tetratricopeptide repeat protein [Thermoanaerobaculia bacterium]
MRAAALALLLAAAGAAFAADGDNELRLGKATLRAGNAGRAMEFFKQAADKGNAEAMHFAGLMYEEGKGVAADPAAAAEWFRRAADKGHPPSMNHLGNLLRNEKPAEALQWHRKAAEAGEPYAMQNVANAYYEGVGAEKNLPQAAEWYRKAAERGNDFAMLRYGYMLSHGEGIPQDVAKAFAMYLASARAGNTAAMFNLGEYYNAGKGVEKSPAAARFWYLRAAMNGETDAEAKVAELADVAPHSAEGAALEEQVRRLHLAASTNAELEAAKGKGFPLTLQAAELGHLPAIATLVYAYQRGEGIEKDMTKAREWALIAAEMGHDSSQTILAQYMLQGVGGPRNTQGARFWFEKSALSGNSLAMSFLAQIYDGAYGLPPNDALATYWWVEAYKKGSPTAQKVLQERGLVAKRDPVAQAYVDRIDRNGPDRSSVENFTLEVAQYCKYGGDRCHELSVAALKFQRSSNAAAESANMARLWNAYGAKDDDAKWRERSDCMKKKTESIQKHTYGQQDWYYAGTCY